MVLVARVYDDQGASVGLIVFFRGEYERVVDEEMSGLWSRLGCYRGGNERKRERY
jgi:hypothetical protein